MQSNECEREAIIADLDRFASIDACIDRLAAEYEGDEEHGRADSLRFAARYVRMRGTKGGSDG